MAMIENWKQVALRSHSMWAQYLALIVLALPEVAFLVLGYDVASPRLWWFVAFALSLYGVIGRIKHQGLSK